jgi:hypothetical protein
MSILVWLGAAGTGVLTGGASGYLASVYSAGPVARRQASAQRQIAAEQTITDIVTDYLGRIRAFELNPQFVYPEDYAAIGGRERLAEDVLAQLPALKGDASWGEQGARGGTSWRQGNGCRPTRLGVPADARLDETTQAAQYEVVERQIRLGYHRGVGCKQELFQFCEVEHFPEVRNDYGVLGLLWLVQGHPFSYMRPKVQAEAIGLLEAILDQVQPGRIKAAKRDEIRASVDAVLGSSRLVRRLRGS